MPLCKCLSSCCRGKDSVGIEVTLYYDENKATNVENDKEGKTCVQEVGSDVEVPKEVILWRDVLGELRSKFIALQDPKHDLVSDTSMDWAFKVLKPVSERPLIRKKEENSLCLKAIKIERVVRQQQNGRELKAVEDSLAANSQNKPKMSNIVPSIGKPAPAFKCTAVVNGEFKDVSLTDYEGKYLVLFFYPLDFTFVCPTEIIAFSERAEEFRAIGCEVVACSTDSHFSHLKWISTPRKEGGLGDMDIPLLADKSMDISKSYGVLNEDSGIAFRGLFIIDGKQNLRQVTINDLPVGRDVDETLRLVQAFQFTDEHGEVCPAGWKPGSKSMKADPKESREYFESQN